MSGDKVKGWRSKRPWDKAKIPESGKITYVQGQYNKPKVKDFSRALTQLRYAEKLARGNNVTG